MRLVLPALLALSLCARCVARDPLPKNLLAESKPQFRLAAETQPIWKQSLPQQRGPLRARWRFSIVDATPWASLTLRSSQDVESCTLNGTRVPPPLKGMRYATLPGISPELLKTGANTLEVEFSVGRRTSKKPAAPTVTLIPLAPADLAFQTEPVLGDAGSDYFTVGCRTNMPAEVTLEAAGKHWESPLGLMHCFRATGLSAATVQTYTLAAHIADNGTKKQIGPFRVSTLPPRGRPLRFVAMGDSRSFPKDWAQVATVVMQKSPMLVLFSGDMVSNGREDRLWDEEFFGVAKPYFASIPTFYVNGNHEDESPLVGRLVPIADRDHWKATAGDAMFIGIDGALDWGPASKNLKWLEAALKECREPFIFVNSHYPPWSSGPHGAAREHAILQAREQILPLMKRYHATAFLAGHDHIYERIEPPDGVTVIVSGGAGAPLYPRVLQLADNPHSKVFASKHNFCLFTIDGNQCSMQALTPEGTLLDSKVWPARPRK